MCREAHSEYYVTLPNMPVAQHAHPADRFARDRWHFDAFWCGALAAADAQAVRRTRPSAIRNRFYLGLWYTTASGDIDMEKQECLAYATPIWFVNRLMYSI